MNHQKLFQQDAEESAIVKLLLLLALFIPSFAYGQPDGTIVRNYKSTFTAPPSRIPSTSAVDAPLLGNGYTAAAIAGAPEKQTYYLTRNDFWRLKSGFNDAFPAVLGKLVIEISELKDATYKIEQDLYNGMSKSSFTNGDTDVEFTSYVSPDDYLIITLENKGKNAINGEVTLSLPGSDQFHISPPLEVKRKDTINSKTENGVQWIMRGFDEEVDIVTMAAAACRIVGSEEKTFRLSAQQKTTIACGFSSKFISDSFLQNLITQMTSITSQNMEEQKTKQEQWWREFWEESQVLIDDALIEAMYYRSLYTMASCSRDPKFPPGLFGSWVTKEMPAWSGDYHLNYNYIAPFYALYSSNHLTPAIPYDAPLIDFMERGKYYSKEIAGIEDGILYPVGIGPSGIETTRQNKLMEDNNDSRVRDGNMEKGGMFFGQKSNASYSLVNMSFRFYHTYNKEYAEKIYPYVKAVAQFWKQYTELEDGKYVIKNDAVHEGTLGDKNPLQSLGLARMVLQTAYDMSVFLNKDETLRADWKNVQDNLADFPTQTRNGKKVFRYTETGTAWWGDNSLGIQHIYPAGAIGLSSPADLLTTAINMIDEMNRWSDFNGTNSFFPAAARVGYSADVILTKLGDYCRNTYPNGFQYNNPHGIENCSTVPNTINEMLCTAHDGILRVFGNWPLSRNASFNKLRTKGAFLVSSELKDGKVKFVKIVSEKGRTCVMKNPWPDKKVVVKGKETVVLEGQTLLFSVNRHPVVLFINNSN